MNLLVRVTPVVLLGCTVGEPVGEGNLCGPLGVYSGGTCW